MPQPWFLRPAPSPEAQRALAVTKLRQMGLILLVISPASALAAAGVGWPPIRTAVAFATAPLLWIGGLWLFSRPLSVVQRTRRGPLYALGATAGTIPGVAVSGLITGSASFGSALIGAICGYAFMAWQIWEAQIIPTDPG